MTETSLMEELESRYLGDPDIITSFDNKTLLAELKDDSDSFDNSQSIRIGENKKSKKKRIKRIKNFINKSKKVGFIEKKTKVNSNKVLSELLSVLKRLA